MRRGRSRLGPRVLRAAGEAGIGGALAKHSQVRPLTRVLLPLVLLATAVPAAATAVPDAVPDRLPLASKSLVRAPLLVAKAPDRAPTRKVVDGRVGDWVGAPTMLGGTSRYDRGELVYSDYLFDDFGADDGGDADRLATLGRAYAAEERTRRADQLFQALGDQFDAPAPVGTPDRYGDGERGQNDLREVRFAASGSTVTLLARTTTLTDARALGVLLLVDRDGKDGASRDVGFGTTLKTTRYDSAVLLTRAGAAVRDLATGRVTPVKATVAVNAAGWDNALEAALPAGLLGPRVGVLAGPTSRGSITPANVAFRKAEPVAGIYNEQRQALALQAGSVDEFARPLDIAGLKRGRSETARPGPGYAERQFVSGANISKERGEDGLWQPYGLYVPTAYKPGTKAPLTMWLHYRGGKAHSGGAWTPRLLSQLGEEQGAIVATPRGRGTSTWYVSEAHQDFFEVFADVQRLLTVDADRRYLAGYSMGGYGTYLFGLLYPDLFAGGFVSSGAMTQGLWTGAGPDGAACATPVPCYQEANGGDADAQNTFRALPNARNLPLVINHGSDDQLAPISGVQRMGARLAELGYRYDLTTFDGYEHYTQAIVDEWADGTKYLLSQRRVQDPRTVTYQVVPALVRAVNTVTAEGVRFGFNPDGAYWTDGLRVRTGADGKDTSVVGRLDATSQALAEPTYQVVPRAGAVSPLSQSTPYVRTGLDWLPTGQAPLANAFTATLTNLSTATLDTDRMKIDVRRSATASVTSDGPAVLVLRGVERAVTVTVGGKAVPGAWKAGTVRIPLTAGTTSVTLTPG